jgi:hypothetical protein
MAQRAMFYAGPRCTALRSPRVSVLCTSVKVWSWNSSSRAAMLWWWWWCEGGFLWPCLEALLCLCVNLTPTRSSPAPARVQEGRKTGSSRGSPTSSPGSTTSGRREGSDSTRPHAAPQQRRASPPPSPRSDNRQAPKPTWPRSRSPSPGPSGRGEGGHGNGTSRLDSFLRRHPIFSRFYDGTLIFGDVVMVVATEVRRAGTCSCAHPLSLMQCAVANPDLLLLASPFQASSERIEWSSFPMLVSQEPTLLQDVLHRCIRHRDS